MTPVVPDDIFVAKDSLGIIIPDKKHTHVNVVRTNLQIK